MGTVTHNPLALPAKTVIFDYGDLISLPQSAADRATIEALAGLDPARFWRAYQAHRLELDLGAEGVRAYWTQIARDTGADWDEVRLQELWVADLRSWMSVNPGTIEVLADLRAGGTRMALLSNAGPDYGAYFRHGPLGDFFDAVYVSGELKLLKPDAAIYEHVLSDLGVPASDAIFTDNRADNVRGAQSLGITGHVFTGAGPLRTFLESLAAS